MRRISGFSVPSRVLGGLIGLALCMMPVASAADTFYIEIDYMVDSDHTHKPQPDEIAAVQQMFACQGHTLVIDVDDAIVHYNVLKRDPANNDFFGYDDINSSYGRIRNDFFDHDNDSKWHYGLFGHQYEDSIGSTTGSSGLGQRPGRLFLVSLGAFTGQTGTAFDRASTLAHEFGHNLGLTHCGTMNCSNSSQLNYVGNGPPVLASIMSYQYQLAGVREQMVALGLARPDASLIKELDYSRGRMCPQNEASLDEDFGSGMNPVDWNCDGTTGGIVAVDLLSEGSRASQHWCNSSGNASTTVKDYVEWSNISASASPEFLASAEAEPEVVMCITAEEWEEIYTTQGIQQPTLTIEPCNTGQIVFVDPDTPIPELATGSCFQPVPDIDLAVDFFTPDGSEVYLKEKEYPIGTGPLVISKPMKIFSVGRAVLR